MNLVGPGLLAVFATTALATLVLAWIARKVGWGDAPDAATAGRKLQRRAVPAVGGVAILLGLALVLAWDHGAIFVTRVAGIGPTAFGATLLLALVVGAIDDHLSGGLPPAMKLGLQLAALVPLAAAAWLHSASIADLVLIVLPGLVAMNLVNTYDNADGAAAGTATLGLAGGAPALAAACAGFLVFNLDARRPWNRASGAPTAYLGDAGSYVVGLLLLIAPGGWAALWIPALDLARLSVVRLRAGSRPWIGDRRHLAHRLQERGLAPGAVVGVLALLAAPACLGVHLGDRAPLLVPVGLALGAVLYLGVLRIASREGRRPCPGPAAPE